MKKKKNTYFLLILVLVIWGMVIYRFFSYTAPEVPGATKPSQLSLKPVDIKPVKNFTIDVNYRDPFLGKMYAPVVPSTTKKGKHKIVEPVTWPQVIYKGIVSDTKEKKKVFMLIVNGKACMMKEKDVQDGILLKKGDRHSVEVKYKGDLTTIMIQE